VEVQFLSPAPFSGKTPKHRPPRESRSLTVAQHVLEMYRRNLMTCSPHIPSRTVRRSSEGKRARTICYGRVTPLQKDYTGERHVVTVRREPTRSPHFFWCQFEERPGPAPAATMRRPDFKKDVPFGRPFALIGTRGNLTVPNHKAMTVLPGSTRKPVPTAKLIGKSDPNQNITVSIYVRRNPNPPAPAVQKVAAFDKQLPGERPKITNEEFNALYGADPADLKKVADWAKTVDLKVNDQSVAKRSMKVEGTIGAIEKAFNIELNEYEHPEEGHFRGRQGDVHIPSELLGVISGVYGLDTRKVGDERIRKINGRSADWKLFKKSNKKLHGVTAFAKLSNPWPGTFFPPQIAQLYQYPPGLDGTGQNIAIFAFNGDSSGDPRGGYKLASLKTYFEQVLGGKTPAIQDVVVQGPGNDPGPDSEASEKNGDSTGEVMLDMCVVGSVAPGAKIFMYFTEFTTQGWLDALSEAITDANDVSVISISYGNPEDDPDGAWTAMGVKQVNDAFEAAIAKQISICVAAGDDGSSDQVSSGAHVDFPASSPNVLGVGGTKLLATAGSPASIANETVWNETQIQDGATGGGISAIFSKPDYQGGANVPVSVNPGHVVGRGVPDVAAVGDPVTGVVIMHVNGTKLEPIGGTSASAPLWASLIAILNQGLNARCGFLNPILYDKAEKGVLNDITSGNNGAYSAGPGWDACTGLGSPNGQRLLHALAPQ
jgi:kumamolisin